MKLICARLLVSILHRVYNSSVRRRSALSRTNNWKRNSLKTKECGLELPVNTKAVNAKVEAEYLITKEWVIF